MKRASMVALVAILVILGLPGLTGCASGPPPPCADVKVNPQRAMQGWDNGEPTILYLVSIKFHDAFGRPISVVTTEGREFGLPNTTENPLNIWLPAGVYTFKFAERGGGCNANFSVP